MSVRLLGIAFFIFMWAAHAQAQEPSAGDGQRVYRKAAPSVFLVEVHDDEGEIIGTGTAFLIEGGRLVTNAHVVQEGEPFLRTDIVTLPLVVEHLSMTDDLAILEPTIPLDAEPLPLTDALPDEGVSIWAIGNPKGLEKSLSSGIVSAVRHDRTTTLIQHTAAISPGSSGGPVLDADGNVLGVIVGAFADGQNLNFAVAAERVLALRRGGSSAHGFEEARAEAIRLGAMQNPGRWSSDPDSPYQAHRRKVEAAFDHAASLAPSGDELLRLATEAYEDPVFDWVTAARIAQQAINRGVSDPDSARIIVLRSYGWTAQFIDDSTTAEYILRTAETALQTRPNNAELHMLRAEALYVLGGDRADIYRSADVAVDRASSGELDDFQWRQQEIFEAFGDYAAADSVFEVRDSITELHALDWSLRADDLLDRSDYRGAGDAFLVAYSLADHSAAHHACQSGNAYLFANDVDDGLEMLRVCIDDYALAPSVDTAAVTLAHYSIATVLSDRGVFPTAETHARQALRLNPTSEWVAYELSRALLGQERYSEAAAAAEEAVRLSDGGIADMHFAAGSAYFELKEWGKCVRAFRLASELDTEEPNAPYNVALCLVNQGYRGDAVQWFEEVLNRMPDHPDRERIERQIRQYRRW